MFHYGTGKKKKRVLNNLLFHTRWGEDVPALHKNEVPNFLANEIKEH